MTFTIKTIKLHNIVFCVKGKYFVQSSFLDVLAIGIVNSNNSFFFKKIGIIFSHNANIVPKIECNNVVNFV